MSPRRSTAGRWLSLLWLAAPPGSPWAEGTLPAPRPLARLAFAPAGGAAQAGFTPIAPSAAGSFATSFRLGTRTVGLAGVGFERLESAPPGSEVSAPGAGSEDIATLLRSSLLCELPCEARLQFSGLAARKRYRVTSYHHSVTNVPGVGGAYFTLQLTGNNPAPLRQSSEGSSQQWALHYSEVAWSDNSGGLSLSLTKPPLSADAHMNLNGIELEEVPDVAPELLQEGESCAAADHKDFGERLSLQLCTELVDADTECSGIFSWCIDANGRCLCGLTLSPAQDCTGNSSEDLVHGSRLGIAEEGCNLYRASEVVKAHLAPAGEMDCTQGPHVIESSCLAAVAYLLNQSGQSLSSRSLQAGSWSVGSALQPPYGCSVSSGLVAYYNRDTGTSPPPGWRQVCFGSIDVTQASPDAAGNCELGFYNPGGEVTCLQCNGGSTRRRRATGCTLCGEGYYDAGDFDDCRRCQGGETRRRRAVECTDCAPGFFDAADDDDCSLCRAGTAARRRRAESCTECQVGTYSRQGLDDCAACAGGYTRRRRSDECTPCPENYFSSAAQDDCRQCASVVDGVCKLAPAS